MTSIFCVNHVKDILRNLHVPLMQQDQMTTAVMNKAPLMTSIGSGMMVGVVTHLSMVGIVICYYKM